MSEKRPRSPPKRQRTHARLYVPLDSPPGGGGNQSPARQDEGDEPMDEPDQEAQPVGRTNDEAQEVEDIPHTRGLSGDTMSEAFKCAGLAGIEMRATFKRSRRQDALDWIVTVCAVISYARCHA